LRAVADGRQASSQGGSTAIARCPHQSSLDHYSAGRFVRRQLLSSARPCARSCRRLPRRAHADDGPGATRPARDGAPGREAIFAAGPRRLGRYGLPVEEAGTSTALMAQQLLRDAPGFLLDWDYQLLASSLTRHFRAGKHGTDEVRRQQAVTSRPSASLTPGWVLESGAPLADVPATGRSGPAALTMLVTAGAVLPKDRTPQATSRQSGCCAPVSEPLCADRCPPGRDGRWSTCRRPAVLGCSREPSSATGG